MAPSATPQAPPQPAAEERASATSELVVPPAPPGVPPAPPACAVPAARVGSAEGCGRGAADTFGALADALSVEAVDPRDAALASLEGCVFFEPGLVRALRADLGPPECADAIAGPLLEERAGTLARDVRELLVGLVLSARLHRLVRQAPSLEPPLTRERFNRFFKEQLVSWIASQAKAIQDTAMQGARLGGYGKVLAAVEAGMADMRFVEVAREVPLPADMAQDAEVRDVYYATLDEALEPRKTRGRDAALVALGHYAALGVLGDARVDSARTLLSRLYGGRRIDALDGLLLPPLPPLEPQTPEARLARRLPTFYMGYLLSDLDPTLPEVLRALLDRGLPAPLLARLSASPLSTDGARLLARAYVQLGTRYWRSEDF